MRPPIFVCYDGDILVFASIKAAEDYIESPDVEDLKAYDAEGKLLTVSAIGYQVKVSEADDSPSCKEELKYAIRRFMEDLTLPIPLSQLDNLAYLVELMKEYSIKE